ncbi:hypothetical protein GCK72_016372 [Caenorhabditis remanei]|uniref:Uncharacterized protein n=1 Tax=Caenorhabditis remanei TaxID=31234 RepID=A0A6A5GZ93_CAERE|nr:hypothetical protein GCK72_016372 [Caenorhabditis remanei]KAF1759905.1 hypothetical protein GCK72_016372 [Caenorhabditis remanei]
MVADFKPLGTPVLVTTMHPGWVLTEMGGANAKITIEESAADMMKSIGKLSKTHNGGLFDRNLEIMPF